MKIYVKQLDKSFVGAWSDYTLVRENEYVLLPKSFTDLKMASCLFINPLTALCFMDIVRKNNSDCVIQTAGASAVGKIFTRLCFLDNIKIINIVRKYLFIN